MSFSGLQRREGKCGDVIVDQAALGDDLVDSTLSEAAKADLQSWQTHDEARNDFCDVHSETCEGCDYIDLTINPERFTGYSGEASRRIWRAIYEENCFKPSKPSGKDVLFLQDSLEDMCLEKRAFYRAVSGLHSRYTELLSFGRFRFEFRPMVWLPDTSLVLSGSSNGLNLILLYRVLFLTVGKQLS